MLATKSVGIYRGFHNNLGYIVPLGSLFIVQVDIFDEVCGIFVNRVAEEFNNASVGMLITKKHDVTDTVYHINKWQTLQADSHRWHKLISDNFIQQTATTWPNDPSTMLQVFVVLSSNDQHENEQQKWNAANQAIFLQNILAATQFCMQCHVRWLLDPSPTESCLRPQPT